MLDDHVSMMHTYATLKTSTYKYSLCMIFYPSTKQRNNEMAFRATTTRYWRSIMMSRIGGGNGNRRFATSTSPKMKVFAPGMSSMDAAETKTGWAMKGEFVPIYVVMGMVVVALSIGAHTAKQQLVHSPTVRVSKKKRESYPEVDDPDHVIASADKFLNKSFLRKVAHIQDQQHFLPDPFTQPRRAETLKTAGVNPARH